MPSFKQSYVRRARRHYVFFFIQTYFPVSSLCRDQGTVALDDMWRCISYLLQLGGTSEGTAEWENAFFLAQRIHRAFQDNDGIVGFAALTYGISILCQLSVEDKVGASSEPSCVTDSLYGSGPWSSFWFGSLVIVLPWLLILIFSCPSTVPRCADTGGVRFVRYRRRRPVNLRRTYHVYRERVESGLCCRAGRER